MQNSKSQTASFVIIDTPLELKLADILIILLASYLCFWLYSHLLFTPDSQGKANRVLIQIGHKVPLEYPLNQNKILSIQGDKGLSVIEIKQGKARFIHSSCRNQFCVFHGWLSAPEETSACLPNRVSITLKGSLNSFDAIAGEQ